MCAPTADNTEAGIDRYMNNSGNFSGIPERKKLHKKILFTLEER